MKENTLIHEFFTLYNNWGEPIRGDLHYKRSFKEKPVIIICHSFMAFKDWGFFPQVANKSAEAGFVVITFNFSRNGVKGDDDRITDFDKFEQNTFTQEIEDLGVIIDSVWNGEVGGGIIDGGKISLLGHSRGGAIALLQASTDKRVKMLMTWSTIASFDRWTIHQKDQWKKNGYLPLAKNSAMSPLRLGINLLHDLDAHREKLDLVKAASRMHIPWLIVHGKADVTVPCREAEILHQAVNKSTTKLVLLDKVGHLYNAVSKDEDNYQTLNKIINITLHWLQHKIS